MSRVLPKRHKSGTELPLDAFTVRPMQYRNTRKRRKQRLGTNPPAKPLSRWIGALGAALGGFAALSASGEPSDPILNLLLQKGIISQQEADKVQSEALAARTNQAALPPIESKWKLTKAIKSIELFGDIRVRYEDRSAVDPGGDRIDLQRLRYSVRVGLRGEVLDDFYYGLRLDPSANARSPWLTMGSASSVNSGSYQGPFGKSTAGINLGQAYFGWRGVDWLDLTVGKMPNPLYTTAMVWDPDVSPEGMAERFKCVVGEADVFVTFGQFLYQDTNPSRGGSSYFDLGYSRSSPLFLMAWQAGVNYHITKDMTLKIAPVLYSYMGKGADTTSGTSANQAPGFGGTFVGQGSTNNLAGLTTGAWSGYPRGYSDGFTANQTGVNDLLVLEVPVELNYRLSKLDLRAFGDYAQNLEGGDRARAAYTASHATQLQTGGGDVAQIPSAQTSETKAYQLGVAVGNLNSLGLVNGTTVRRHGWELRTYWQHVEQYALDPNLIDSDFFEGRENLEGVFAAAAYSLGENVIGTVRYGYASRINNKLGTGGSNQDIPQMNPIDHYNLFQVDLTFKF